MTGFENLLSDNFVSNAKADLSMFNSVGVNQNIPVDNASFWREGKEIKINDLPDSHPDKARLQSIDKLDNNIAAINSAYFMAQMKMLSQPQLEKLFKQITLETETPRALQDQINQLTEETTKLYKDRAIETKAESSWLTGIIRD